MVQSGFSFISVLTVSVYVSNILILFSVKKKMSKSYFNSIIEIRDNISDWISTQEIFTNETQSKPIIFTTKCLSNHVVTGAKRRLSTDDIPKDAKRIKAVETMEQLPNELLLEIFNRMNQETLKTCTLVNKKWHNMIIQTTSTMTELPLLIKDENVKENVQLTRKYKCVTLSEIFTWNDQLMEEFEGIGSSVEELNLNDCVFFGNDFAYILACFPMLTELNIRWCSFGNSKYSKAKNVDMKHLRKMIVEGEGWMLKHIKCNLHELTLTRLYHDDQPTVIAFLNRQNSLESLSLEHICDLFCSLHRQDPIVVDFKFELRSLSMNVLPFADVNNMKALLQRARNCEDVNLGIDIAPWIPQHILKKFHNMRSLDIDFELLPHLKSFYYDVKPNIQLKNLRIDGFFEVDSEESLLGLLSHYPCTELLDIFDLAGFSSADHSLWKQISQTAAKIRNLRMRRLNIFNMSDIKFRLLTDLEVDILGYTNDAIWKEFGNNNPNIKSLNIQSVPCSPLFDLDCVIINLKKLVHLIYTTSCFDKE